MILLLIDTSGPVAGVALVENGAVRYESMAVNAFTHSQSILPMVEEAYLRTGLSPEKTDYFAVTVGPGSFTGVRIGVTTVKGLAHADGKIVRALRWPGMQMQRLTTRQPTDAMCEVAIVSMNAALHGLPEGEVTPEGWVILHPDAPEAAV